LRKPQLIGLHAKSKTSTSRWFGIDIDNHADDATSVDDLARRNLNAAVNWHDKLRSQGYDPILFDSNGAGGYHLWVLFKEPAPTEDVFSFAMETVADWEEQQLDKLPETFPKRVKKDSLGSWFRLPGLHHTRHHHAAVWSGEDSYHDDDPWLRGHAAIDVMLHNLPGPPPPKSKKTDTKTARSIAPKKLKPDATASDPKPVPSKRSFKRTSRAKVCVDLDGVLAHKTGNNSIGPPIDGAVEFTRALHEESDILIFTARFATKSNKPRSASVRRNLHDRIESWLNHHGFAWDEICSDAAKPIASAYIDDRAVPCSPLDHGLEAYDAALLKTRDLL